MPENYEIEFINSKNENEYVKSFHFRKPADFRYRAGQFIVLRLVDGKLDPKSSLRQFSLSSAPYEEDLVITTTVKGRNSRFKESLDAMITGQEVKMFGPNGNFFQEDEKGCLLIAGDMGITPFRSIIMQSLSERKDSRFTLIHYYSADHFRLFLEDLEKVPGDLLKIVKASVHSLDQVALESNDSTYQIKECINDELNMNDGLSIMIAGPPLFVDSVTGIINSVEMEKHIRVKKEKFTGY